MEQLIVQSLCTGAPVRLINCNGHGVTLEAIARRVGTLGRLLQRKYRPLVVVFDRERRTEESSDIKTSFLQLLHQEGIKSDVIVAIPDTMIENWLLADLSTLSSCVGITVGSEIINFEGSNGEKELKRLLPKPLVYVKTIHGVQWFLRCRPEAMKKGSKSFSDFYEALSSVPCRWLEQRELF
jgi:Domain of unknown function (DUF4276)